ncbi:MAG: DNA repair exonuclease [DPANN group archaeon]|nr:DNA repair exonuclease [DPANN group archaeon]
MLKVAIISDTHLGFAWGEERQEDSFRNLEQAFSLAAKQEPDLVLLAGDIFHDRIPRQEILGRAIEIFSKFCKKLKSRPFCVKAVRDGNTHEIKNNVPPIIAIWGTHERRHADSTNPLHLLEKAGLITLLHAESVLFEINSDQIGIHGLSGVPEQLAKDALRAWEPEPFDGAANILMLHQNFKEIMPPVDYFLEFSDLPDGFDLAVLGHIHNTQIKKHPLTKMPILVAGLTVSTQLQKIESEVKKGFYVAEAGRHSINLKFVPLETRPFFYESIDATNLKPAEISAKIIELAKKYILKTFYQKPVIRIKVSGILPENFLPSDFDSVSLVREFSDKLILSLDKSGLVSQQLAAQSKLLQELKASRLSIDQIGIEILGRSLKEKCELKKLESIFFALVAGEMENAEALI